MYYDTHKKRSPGRPGYKYLEEKMKLVTFHMPRHWILALDTMVKEGKGPSRSEIIRYAVRDLLIAEGHFRPYEKEVF